MFADMYRLRYDHIREDLARALQTRRDLMDFKQKCFLVAAEELNMTRAAKRLFVTQQNLSHHIRSIETEYGHLLFNRKPRLSLTEFGKEALITLRQIESLEANLQHKINNMNAGIAGSLLLGLHTVRAQTCFPQIAASYRSDYPDIHISIHHGLSKNFESATLNGTLDMFIGVNVAHHDELEIIHLHDEEMLLVVSDELLRRFTAQSAAKLDKDGIDIELFKNAPFIINDEGSRINSVFMSNINKLGVLLNIAIKINNPFAIIDLVANNVGVGFCPQSFLTYVFKNFIDTRNIHAFKISNFTQVNKISIVYSRNIYHPKYRLDFIKHAVKEFSSR